MCQRWRDTHLPLPEMHACIEDLLGQSPGCDITMSHRVRATWIPLEPPPESQLPPTQSGGVVLQGGNQKQFFWGERGALKPVATFLFTIFFQPAEKTGEESVSPQKTGPWHKTAQTGINQYKLAQTSTNLLNFCAVGGEKLTPFSLFVTLVGCIGSPSRRGNTAFLLAIQGVGGIC